MTATNKLSKKMKIGIVVSAAWFLIILLICLANAGRSFDMEELAILLGWGIILISIGWSIWWIKQED